MMTVYLSCFVVGLVLSLLAVVSGGGTHFHLGHFSAGHAGTAHAGAKGGGSAFNGFTLAVFLCWFGGVGYLLGRYRPIAGLLALAAAILAGLAGAVLVYSLIFRLLLPRERVLTVEDTRMEGTLARVSDAVRAPAGLGEILFSQMGVRRSAPARSEDGVAIARDTEVIVLRYERGIAYVRPFHETGLKDVPDSIPSNF